MTTGNEAEDARKAIASDASGGAEEIQPLSEMMGFQALGVVMGPLMLGTLIDELDPSPGTENEDAPRKSMESAKKGDKKSEKKQKRTSVTKKLDRDATLCAHVDRANLTANIMELLLIIWKDVVVQLRELQAGSSSSSPQDASRQLSKTRSRTDSGQQFGASDEELFMNMMRGRPLPADFSGSFKMKAKVKVERSPMSRRVRRASSSTLETPATMVSSGELPGNTDTPPTGAAAFINNNVRVVEDSGSNTTRSLDSNNAEGCDIQKDQRTKSDIAMAQMSMGTILPRLQDSPVTTLHEEMLRTVSRSPHLELRPETPTLDQVPAGTPETVLRDVTKPETDAQKVMKRRDSSVDRPLPPIGAAQRAELSPQKCKEDHDAEDTTNEFPTRKSSLPQDKGKQKQLSVRSVELSQSIVETSPSVKPRSRSSTTPNSRKVNQAGIDQATDGKHQPRPICASTSCGLLSCKHGTHPGRRQSTPNLIAVLLTSHVAIGASKLTRANSFILGGSRFPERSKRGSVKLLAQRFDETPKPDSGPGSMASDIPTIYAKIYALPLPNSERPDDPFLSSSDTSPERGPERVSRIPKPTRDSANTQNICSRSPSPPKSPQRSPSPPKRPPPKNKLKKRTSVFKVLPDRDAEMVKQNSIRSSETTGTTLRSGPLQDESNAVSTATVEQVASQLTELLRKQDALDEIIAPQPSRSPPPPPPKISSNDHKRTSSSIYLDVVPTRPLSAYSKESLRRMRLEDEPPVARHVPTRVISVESNASNGSKATNTVGQSTLNGLERKGSFNTAMSVEIGRLRRLLEHKDREVRETRRSLDASRDTWEDAVTADGSPKKGTLANELRVSRKETAEWKKRAEWAESRLAIIDGERKPEREYILGPSTARKGGSGIERPKNWLHE